MKSCFVFIFFLIGLVLSEEIPNVFINTNIEHKIDLSSDVVKHVYKMTIKSVEGSISKYIFLIPQDHFDHMATLEAKQKQIKYPISRIPDYDIIGSVAYLVKFTSPITDNDFNFKIIYTLINVISFLPESIKQNDNQLCVYTDSSIYVSPYVTKEQSTIVSLPSTKFELDTTKNNRSISGKELTYGPFTDIEPYSSSVTLYVHYTNTIPFIRFTKLVREIEISHWGNIAFEETIYAMNNAAALQGEYSRLDYDNNYYKNPATVNDRSWSHLEATIPRESKDFYYRDIIGNISTSTVDYQYKSTRIEFDTRFPLMGQWKTEFYWGYNLPINKAIQYTKGKYVLTTPFNTPITTGTIDELIVRVILPECVSNIDYNIPNGVTAMNTTTRYTYLDTKGRPVLEFKQNNVLSTQSDNISVSYSLSSILLFREPIMCISVFFLLFLLASVTSRLNFSLGEKPEEKVKTD